MPWFWSAADIRFFVAVGTNGLAKVRFGQEEEKIHMPYQQCSIFVP